MPRWAPLQWSIILLLIYHSKHQKSGMLLRHNLTAQFTVTILVGMSSTIQLFFSSITLLDFQLCLNYFLLYCGTSPDKNLWELGKCDIYICYLYKGHTITELICLKLHSIGLSQVLPLIHSWLVLSAPENWDKYIQNENLCNCACCKDILQKFISRLELSSFPCCRAAELIVFVTVRVCVYKHLISIGRIEILCHDINVHIPHHISSRIPSYNLRAAHKSLQENWGKVC